MKDKISVAQYRKLSGIKEQDIVRACIAYLQPLENLGRLYFIRNNSGAFKKEYKGNEYFTRFGKEGSSDIFIFMPVNSGPAKGTVSTALFIEVKRPGEKQSPAQREFERKITALGFRYHLIISADELKAIVETK